MRIRLKIACVGMFHQHNSIKVVLVFNHAGNGLLWTLIKFRNFYNCANFFHFLQKKNKWPLCFVFGKMENDGPQNMEIDARDFFPTWMEQAAVEEEPPSAGAKRRPREEEASDNGGEAPSVGAKRRPMEEEEEEDEEEVEMSDGGESPSAGAPRRPMEEDAPAEETTFPLFSFLTSFSSPSFAFITPPVDAVIHANTEEDAPALIYFAAFISKNMKMLRLVVEPLAALVVFLRRDGDAVFTKKCMLPFDREAYTRMQEGAPKLILKLKKTSTLLIVQKEDGDLDAWSSGANPTVLFLHALAEHGAHDLQNLMAKANELAVQRELPRAEMAAFKQGMYAIISLVEKYKH